MKPLGYELISQAVELLTAKVGRARPNLAEPPGKRHEAVLLFFVSGCSAGIENPQFSANEKSFLGIHDGPAVAGLPRLEHHQGYGDALLGIRAIRGKRAGAIWAYCVREMIGQVRRPANKRLWRVITLLPGPLAKRAYCLWRGPSPLKQMVKTAVLPLLRP